MRQRIPDRFAVVSWALAAVVGGCLLPHGVVAAQDVEVSLQEVLPPLDASAPKLPPLQPMPPGSAPAASEAQLILYRLRHARATTVTDVLQKMLDSSPGKVVADERNNAIIVSGPPKTHERVKQLIEGLDVPEPDATRVTRVYRLEQADPVSVGRTLSDLFADEAMSVGVDKRSRSVIILAPAEVHRRAAELIEQLDRSVEAEESNRTEIFTLKYADSAPVAKLLRDVICEEIPDAQIHEDDRLNSILLSGSDAAVARAAALIDQLDVPGRQRALHQYSVKVFRLQHAEAVEILKTVVAALAPEGSVAADKRTNSIIATGPEEELKVIEAVLLRLDEEAEDHR